MLLKKKISKLKEGLRRRAYRLHPRSFYWNYHCHHYPDDPLIARIDKDLKARVWPGDVIGKSLYVSGLFERQEVQFIKHVLQPGMIFFDIGANMGFYSLIAAKRLGESGKIHSFEPNPRMFEELKYNIDLNGFSNVKLNCLALADRTRVARLSRYERGKEVYCSLSDRNFPGADIIGYDDVRVETLYNYVKKMGINRIDLIKMDVEGAELMVLQGALSLLESGVPRMIIFELAQINVAGFGYHCEEVLDLLRSFGYTIYKLDNDGNLIKINLNPIEYPGSPSFVASK